MLDGMMYGAGTGADPGDGVAEGHLQRDWLVTQINASTAQWKFIVCQIPFKSDELNSDDKWGMYDPTDAQYDYLRTQITADNVVWLAADRHFAGMDDGETLATDPWPVILPGPMYGDAIHEADGEYFGLVMRLHLTWTKILSARHPLQLWMCILIILIFQFMTAMGFCCHQN